MINWTTDFLIDEKLKGKDLSKYDNGNVRNFIKKILFDMSCKEIMEECMLIFAKKSKLNRKERDFCVWVAGEFAKRGETVIEKESSNEIN